MSSSLQGKKDSHLRIVSSEDAVVFPENAAPTDDAPTVISKTTPNVDAVSSSQQKNFTQDLARQAMSPETLVASLRGRRLAHYELIEPIGVGGMAAVIRARDTQLDRFVALKILPPEMALESENVQRFHQEAKAAAELDHENIARVFYCGADQGLHFIAFEFVEGINLRTMLERRGKLPVGEAVRYVLQVAAGLEHAATRGVVHRDVKPSNIIITPTGRAKLVDMGLARNLERQGERDLTQSGVTLGTFDYISPEQALEPREADSRSDIYSLGCTFYHMLTGKASVPDGTPAKKLHHHQHVAPEDPRQTNPDIPDEVIEVLGRMMAKNPKDRFQRPVHLVQRLVPLAKKIGAVDDVPEGVLFVDARVVDQARSRPFLMIGMALALLVAVTLLLSFAPDRAPAPTKVPSNEKAVENPAQPPKPDANHLPTDPVPRPAVASRPYPIKDANDMLAALADNTAAEVTATIEDRIDLGENGLSYRGAADQKLIIEADKDITPNATIAFRYKKKSGAATAGLSLDGGKEVVFRRIRFQLDSDRTPGKAVSAVMVRRAKTVIFDKCVFSQTGVPALSPLGVPFASLLIATEGLPDDARPTVILRDCCFDSNGQAGGQVCVAIDGPANVNATSCAFMPHGAFFQFRHDSKLPYTGVLLQHCTGFVTKGPAFRFDADTSAGVTVKQSAYLRPNGVLATLGMPEPDLIYLADRASIQYVGNKNLYYNLNADVAKQGEGFFKGDAFQKYLDQTGGSDKEALRDFSASPFYDAQPLPLTGAQEAAFELKAEFKIYGLDRWLDHKMAEAPEPIVKTAPIPKFKLVDPATGGSKPGVFKFVEQALKEAKDGDEIQINAGENQEIKLTPIHVTPGISVTLKPFGNSRPILVLDNTIALSDSYFFKVQSGRINLEQMEFRLDPGPTPFDCQSIVQLGETAQCSFKNCVISLKTAKKEQLNVVTFLDADKMMKMETSAAAPARVEFQDCFVHGCGDLVSLRGCRLLNVDVKQSLIALDGSLLDIRAADKTMPMDQGVRWKMERSSVFTAESIFALRSTTSGKGLTTTSAKIEGCLLVALAPRQPVVLMHATRDEKYLEWDGKQNFYAQFDELRDWKDQHDEPMSFYEKVVFPKLDEEALQANMNLWDATPEWFKPADADKDRLNGFGVPDLDHLLARPLKAEDN